MDDPRSRLVVPQRIARAAAQGDVEVVVQFLQQNPNHLNALTCGQNTLLHVASKYGQVDVVRALIDMKADLEAPDVRALLMGFVTTSSSHIPRVYRARCATPPCTGHASWQCKALVWACPMDTHVL